LIGSLVSLKFDHQETGLLLVDRQNIDRAYIRRELVAGLRIFRRAVDIPLTRE
jgi:hypothetical protein